MRPGQRLLVSFDFIKARCLRRLETYHGPTLALQAKEKNTAYMKGLSPGLEARHKDVLRISRKTNREDNLRQAQLSNRRISVGLVHRLSLAAEANAGPVKFGRHKALLTMARKHTELSVPEKALTGEEGIALRRFSNVLLISTTGKAGPAEAVSLPNAVKPDLVRKLPFGACPSTAFVHAMHAHILLSGDQPKPSRWNTQRSEGESYRIVPR